jgi:branched-chain amino acid transport system substrate-binding protein
MTGVFFPGGWSARATRAIVLGIAASAIVMSSAPASAQKVLKLGVLGPLTGDLAFGGQFQLKGAQLRADELNKSQDKVKIEIIAEDDESKCDVSVSAARKLIVRNNIHALLGAWQSTCTLAIVPITAAASIPQYTTSIASPITQQGSQWIFRVAVQSKQLNQATIAYAVKNLGLKKIAILTSNEEAGKSLAVTTAAALKEHGLEPAGKEEYARGDKDFTGQLGRIRAAGADAVVIGTGFQEQAIIARQVKELGMNMRVLGGDTMGGNPKFVDLGGKYVEGMVFSTVFVPSVSNPRTADFVKGYQAKYKEKPDPWAGQFYDAVGLIFEAVKANGYNIDSKQIGEFTRKLDSEKTAYSGIMGNLYFDKTGDGAWPPMIAEIGNTSNPDGDFWKIISK